jgi:copper chaperone CopZ
MSEMCYGSALQIPPGRITETAMCPSADNTSTAREYAVNGMTCGHCVIAVTQEVDQVPGVTRVEVELEAGRVVVQGEGFSDEAIRDAVEEAGYEVIAS